MISRTPSATASGAIRSSVAPWPLEGSECLLEGDVETGKLVLRDFINATIGFEALGAGTGTAPKSLMRMLELRGNSRARNLFAVLGHLQKANGVRLTVRAA